VDREHAGFEATDSERAERRQDYQRAARSSERPGKLEAREPLPGLQLPGYRRWVDLQELINLLEAARVRAFLCFAILATESLLAEDASPSPSAAAPETVRKDSHYSTISPGGSTDRSRAQEAAKELQAIGNRWMHDETTEAGAAMV
jgi:hypothetical protein